jgi:hypothetical protein
VMPRHRDAGNIHRERPKPGSVTRTRQRQIRTELVPSSGSILGASFSRCSPAIRRLSGRAAANTRQTRAHVGTLYQIHINAGHKRMLFGRADPPSG